MYRYRRNHFAHHLLMFYKLLDNPGSKYANHESLICKILQTIFFKGITNRFWYTHEWVELYLHPHYDLMECTRTALYYTDTSQSRWGFDQEAPIPVINHTDPWNGLGHKRTFPHNPCAVWHISLICFIRNLHNVVGNSHSQTYWYNIKPRSRSAI